MKRQVIGAVLITAAVVVVGMLGFSATTSAQAPRSGKVPPFADSAGQRLDIIAQLKLVVAEMKTQNQLLLEQNKLLKSGKLQVLVSLNNGRSR